jgi:hypothetical protein
MPGDIAHPAGALLTGPTRGPIALKSPRTQTESNEAMKVPGGYVYPKMLCHPHPTLARGDTSVPPVDGRPKQTGADYLAAYRYASQHPCVQQSYVLISQPTSSFVVVMMST